MSKDETPPHVIAIFDQQEKAQQEEDRLPDGVVAQVRVRRADMGEGYDAMAASFVINLKGLHEAASLLITLEEVAKHFAADLAKKLAFRSMESPAGALEAFEILQTIAAARSTDTTQVKRVEEVWTDDK